MDQKATSVMRASMIVQVPLAAALVLLGIGCGYKIPKDTATARGEQIFELCTSCHGQAAEGRPEYHAPSIAGLPQWYIEAQLKKFKSGARGAHPQDHTGMMMRPMTLTFHNDADLTTVAAHVASLPPQKPQVTIAGDAGRGKTLFAVCTACHGPEGSGNEQLKAPPLTHSSDWYLVTQLQKFKDGRRGTNPADVEGATMRPMMATLPDDQAIKDVVAHIATLRR